MFAVVLLALVIAELYVMVLVAGQIGVLDTIGLLILVSIVGAALVKRAGIGVLRRAQRTLAEGATPHKEAVDGLLLFAAGVLVFVPGFVTGALGLLLLVPPVRALLRGRLIKSFRARTAFALRFVDGFGRRADLGGAAPRDATSSEVNEQPLRPPPELEG
ncbi:MAG: FxsA family protein [Acidimicrobiales bacterium]